MDTVDAIVELEIFGEHDEWFLETDKKKKVNQYDDNWYVIGTKMEIPIGIHKSRLIKWISPIQLKLFES